MKRGMEGKKYRDRRSVRTCMYVLHVLYIHGGVTSFIKFLSLFPSASLCLCLCLCVAISQAATAAGQVIIIIIISLLISLRRTPLGSETERSLLLKEISC